MEKDGLMKLRIWLSFRLVRLAQMINPGLMGSIVDMLDAIPGIDQVIQDDRDSWEGRST